MTALVASVAGDWARLGRYAAANLAVHADAAGRLAEVLDEPGFVVHADPTSLLSVARPGRTPEHPALAALRLFYGKFGAAGPGERAAYLELGARYVNQESYAEKAGALPLPRPWRVDRIVRAGTASSRLAAVEARSVGGLAQAVVVDAPAATSTEQTALVRTKAGRRAVATLAESDHRPVVRLLDTETGDLIAEYAFPFEAPRSAASSIARTAWADERQAIVHLAR